MLEILQYITSGFWVFIGSFILIPTVIATIGWSINAILLGIRGKDCGNVNILS